MIGVTDADTETPSLVDDCINEIPALKLVGSTTEKLESCVAEVLSSTVKTSPWEG